MNCKECGLWKEHDGSFSFLMPGLRHDDPRFNLHDFAKFDATGKLVSTTGRNEGLDTFANLTEAQMVTAKARA